MRDIRIDLRERLQVTVSRRTELTEQIRALEAQEQRLRALLRDEESAHAWPELVPVSQTCGGGPLREFVLGSLADGHQWSLEDLKAQAHGLGLSSIGASGRSLNITLVTLRRQGMVARRPNGRWQLQDQGGQLPLPLDWPPRVAEEAPDARTHRRRA